MNDLIPNWQQGETIAALVVERMQQSEREAVSEVHPQWRALAEDAHYRCQKRAVQVVDSAIAHITESLKESFCFVKDTDRFQERLLAHSQEKRADFIRVFEKFSQSDLEMLTSESTVQVIEKWRSIALKMSELIPKEGAMMLMGLVNEPKNTSPSFKPQESLIQQVVDQHLKMYSKGILHGTAWCFQIVTRQYPRRKPLQQFLQKLYQPGLEEKLFASLNESFSTQLAVEYEARFSEKELIQLINIQNRTIYKKIDEVIGVILHQEAVRWMTQNARV